MDAYTEEEITLDIEGLTRNERAPDTDLLQEINVFQRLGFRQVIGGQLAGPVETEYTPEGLPNVALVSNNDVSPDGGGKAPIEHGMLFLKSGEQGNSYLYMSLPSDTPQDKVDALEREHGAFFAETPAGQFYGYIPIEGRAQDGLSPEQGAPGDSPIPRAEKLLMNLSKLELKTVPYPFTADAMRFLPPFINDKNTHGRTADQWAEKVGHVFMDSHGVIAMPDKQKDIATQVVLGNKTPGMQADAPSISSPRPDDNAMHMRRRA
jgi:hypothetical protein